MNKTKIIATVGPATSDKEKIREMITSGVDVIRLNMSHASLSFCREVVTKVNELNKELNTFIGTMIDLKGPVVQVNKLTDGKAFLKLGDKIRVHTNDIVGDYTGFSVDYKDLIEDVKIGDSLMINDGNVKLVIIGSGKDYVLCEVEKEGYIYENKTINLPNSDIKLPFLCEDDKKAIELANELNVDFLALSFITGEEDVLQINDMLIEMGNDHMSIISKIENELAVNFIDNIIKVSDGIMIARGDLGVEMSVEKIPGIQKKIIRKCSNAGVISIVATEMLATMEYSAHPTRAEVSDIANAILDGTDAVMLSGETTIGKYPIETIQMMERVIKVAEEDIDYDFLMNEAIRSEKKDMTGVLAYCVAGSANSLKCKAIVVPTMAGHTARKISRFRPVCPIIAVSPNIDTVKSLSLNFGVLAVLIEDFKNLEVIIEKSKIIAKELISLEEGDKVVVTGGYPFRKIKHTNFMKIEEI